MNDYSELFLYFLDECLCFFGKPKRPRRKLILEFPVAGRDNETLASEARLLHEEVL